MTKIVVYTCTFLDYDNVYTPVTMTPGVDYVLFSDRKPRFVRGWQWRGLPPEVAGLSQAMANRWCKFFPDRLFPDADVTIYVDGKTLMKGDLRPLVQEFLASGAEIGLFRHKDRTSIDAEFAFCVQVGKVKPADVARGEAQLATYYAEGFPREHGLTENGIIFRRHDGPGLKAAMQLWWDQMQTHTQRDQLSGPYVLWKTGLPVHVWPWYYGRRNPYFLRYPHRGKGTSLGYDLEMYAFVQKHRKGAAGVLFHGIHAVVSRMRGEGPRRHAGRTARP
jgi:hypothetical protein